MAALREQGEKGLRSLACAALGFRIVLRWPQPPRCHRTRQGPNPGMSVPDRRAGVIDTDAIGRFLAPEQQRRGRVSASTGRPHRRPELRHGRCWPGLAAPADRFAMSHRGLCDWCRSLNV